MCYRGFLLILALIGSTAPIPSSAADFYVQGGIIAVNLKRPATESNSSAKTLGAKDWLLGATWDLSSQKVGFYPAINFTPLGRGTRDDAATVRIVTFAAPLAARLGPLDFKLGPGLMFQIISGSGGTVELRNGSQTQTFYKPAGMSASRLLFLDAGIGMRLGEKLRFDADVYAVALLSSRRAFNALATLGWGIL